MFGPIKALGTIVSALFDAARTVTQPAADELWAQTKTATPKSDRRANHPETAAGLSQNDSASRDAADRLAEVEAEQEVGEPESCREVAEPVTRVFGPNVPADVWDFLKPAPRTDSDRLDSAIAFLEDIRNILNASAAPGLQPPAAAAEPPGGVDGTPAGHQLTRDDLIDAARAARLRAETRPPTGNGWNELAERLKAAAEAAPK